MSFNIRMGIPEMLELWNRLIRRTISMVHMIGYHYLGCSSIKKKISPLYSGAVFFNWCK